MASTQTDEDSLMGELDADPENTGTEQPWQVATRASHAVLNTPPSHRRAEVLEILLPVVQSPETFQRVGFDDEKDAPSRNGTPARYVDQAFVMPDFSEDSEEESLSQEPGYSGYGTINVQGTLSESPARRRPGRPPKSRNDPNATPRGRPPKAKPGEPAPPRGPRGRLPAFHKPQGRRRNDERTERFEHLSKLICSKWEINDPREFLQLRPEVEPSTWTVGLLGSIYRLSQYLSRSDAEAKVLAEVDSRVTRAELDVKTGKTVVYERRLQKRVFKMDCDMVLRTVVGEDLRNPNRLKPPSVHRRKSPPPHRQPGPFSAVNDNQSNQHPQPIGLQQILEQPPESHGIVNETAKCFLEAGRVFILMQRRRNAVQDAKRAHSIRQATLEHHRTQVDARQKELDNALADKARLADRADAIINELDRLAALSPSNNEPLPRYTTRVGHAGIPGQGVLFHPSHPYNSAQRQLESDLSSNSIRLQTAQMRCDHQAEALRVAQDLEEELETKEMQDCAAVASAGWALRELKAEVEQVVQKLPNHLALFEESLQMYQDQVHECEQEDRDPDDPVVPRSTWTVLFPKLQQSVNVGMMPFAPLASNGQMSPGQLPFGQMPPNGHMPPGGTGGQLPPGQSPSGQSMDMHP